MTDGNFNVRCHDGDPPTWFKTFEEAEAFARHALETRSLRVAILHHYEYVAHVSRDAFGRVVTDMAAAGCLFA